MTDPTTSPGPTAPTPSDLHRWVVAATDRLGVDPDAVDVDALLDLARDVAHTVARPAVPLTTFLAGYAVARGSGDRAALERVVREVEAMLGAWPDGAPDPGAAPADPGRGAADEDGTTDESWSGEGTA